MFLRDVGIGRNRMGNVDGWNNHIICPVSLSKIARLRIAHYACTVRSSLLDYIKAHRLSIFFIIKESGHLQDTAVTSAEISEMNWP